MYFLLLIVGFVSGIFSGLFGIGGGVIIVPSLILICGFSMSQASGTSLVALLPPVGILGCIHFYKAKMINLKAACFVALGIITSITFGAKLANQFGDVSLKHFYGWFLLYPSWRFIKPLHYLKLFCHKRGIEILPHVDIVHKENEERDHWLAFLIIGLIAGIMAGLFGVGGGVIIVPALTGFMYFCPKRAAATSLAVLLPPIGLPGVIEYYQHGKVALWESLPVVVGLFAGTLFGARFSTKLHPEIMKVLYGFFLLFVAIRYIVFV